MNCYNGESFLRKSLNSIKKQSYKNWELIFYDNCSTDKSKNILKTFKDKRIKYFKSNKFLRLYDARNKAINKAQGEYLGFLDTDDTWSKDKLKYQINFLKKNKSDILYTNYYINNEKKKTKYLKSNYNLPDGYITQSLLNDYCIGILTTLINKKVFKKIKFNYKLEIIGDFDFFVRSSIKYKINSINKPLATYRFHSNNLSQIKLQLYIEELESWIRANNNQLKKFNLIKFKIYLIKLQIKKFFNFF
jgi:glycosyltransferase involved in cell wall biosynthesis